MIQNATADERTYEGNLAGEEIQMGVANMAKLMGIVTDLYADRELACIREYSTNGRDAHVAAGINLPIEVTTPTALSPFLTIRDFGIGMSLEDIRVTYSQYGASTKTQSNDFNGMLGLGSKSAMSYADQFTVTSIKDGVRIQVVVSRTASGASMKVVDTSDTSEPNGTTVTIPVRAYNSIERKAKDFFKFWQPGTVLLNGNQPEKLPGAKWLNDDLAIIDGGQNFIVMGGVPYPHQIHTGLGYSQGIAAFVPIGSVDFAPSREALMDTDTTKATVAKVQAAIRAEMAAAIQKDIDAATSRMDAIKRRQEWLRKVPSGMVPALKYKGMDLPAVIKVPDGTVYVPFHGSKVSAHNKLRDGGAQVTIDVAAEAVVVNGYDKVSFTATHKKKLLQYFEEKGLTLPNVWLLTPHKPDMTWLNPVMLSWADVNAVKLPRNVPNPRTGRIPGSYDLYEDGDYNEGVPGDDIDTTKPVFWTVNCAHATAAQWLTKSYPGCTLVMLQERRVDKFCRNFPESKKADMVFADAFKAWEKKLDKDDVTAYVIQNDYSYSDLAKLDASRVDDPDLARAIKVCKLDVTNLKKEQRAWRNLGQYFAPDADKLSNPLHKYPLFDGYALGRHTEAIYRYLNCEYAYLKGQA